MLTELSKFHGLTKIRACLLLKSDCSLTCGYQFSREFVEAIISSAVHVESVKTQTFNLQNIKRNWLRIAEKCMFCVNG